MADVIGMRLGRYEIRERLGRGGMATVYKAWDTNLDRWVAVKILHDHLADDPDFKIRFEREAKVVAALNHPNIVQIFDFDRVELNGETLYYMVMPLIKGPSLRMVMEQREKAGETMTSVEIEQVMEAVCKALTYAHSQGMIHRDVTPSNILFNENGPVVLADFGLARLVSGGKLTQTGMTTGTPVYMSPEQGTGDQVDGRSDIYSLGVVLYEMLTGVVPFDGDTAYALIMKHVNEPVPLSRLQSKNVPRDLERVILRTLAKNPEDRYQSADMLFSDYKKAVLGTLDTALRTGVGTVLLPAPGKRQKAGQFPLYLAGGALVIVLLIGGIAFLRSATVPDRSSVVTLAILPTRKPQEGNSMTESSIAFTHDFSKEKPGMWMLGSEDERIQRGFEDGVLRITNRAASTAATTIINPRSSEYSRPIVIEAEMMISLQSQSPSATGIIFRYKSDDQYYVFAIDGERRVSIWKLENQTWIELRHLPNGDDWTFNEAVHPLGQKNHLKVIVNGNKLDAYVNGVEVIQVSEAPSIMRGGVGVYIATTTNSNEDKPFAGVDVYNYSVQFYNDATMTPLPTATAN